MASSASLVAPPIISRRAGMSRVLASVLCIVVGVVFISGYHSRDHSLFPKSLLLHDGIPNDREIEFESSVAQQQGAKVTLTPVPNHVLSMFERAVDEQKRDLDAQPLVGDYVDNTLNMHRDAEKKVFELACKITPKSPRCEKIAVARAARAAAAAQAKAKADADAKSKVQKERAKEISEAVSKATAAANAKLKAALEEVAKMKLNAAAELKAAKADADSKIEEAKAQADALKAQNAKSDAQLKAAIAQAQKLKAAKSEGGDVLSAAKEKVATSRASSSASASAHSKKK